MNERIMELFEQAELNLELQLLKVEKFAELIVRECINRVLFNDMNHEHYYMRLNAADDIEKHFGVE